MGVDPSFFSTYPYMMGGNPFYDGEDRRLILPSPKYDSKKNGHYNG